MPTTLLPRLAGGLVLCGAGLGAASVLLVNAGGAVNRALWALVATALLAGVVLLLTAARRMARSLTAPRRAGREPDARTDPLTGIPNRRGLDEELQRELSRAARLRSGICLALIELDHFKRYRDRHGRPAGDRFLRELASSWRAELRTSDLLARAEGEKFVVLLLGCEAQGARRLLDRLQAATPYGETCSAGIAVWDGQEGPDPLIHRADVALRAAKTTGGDRVVLDTTTLDSQSIPE